MDSGFVIEVTFKALWMAFILSGPVLIALLVVGLVIALFVFAFYVSFAHLNLLCDQLTFTLFL